MSDSREDFDFEILEKEITKTPSLYKVIMFNDNYTTMDFVVDILIEVFNKKEEDAIKIMLDIHRTGSGICGVFPYEIAETKVNIVHSKAREKGFPLRCGIEKE
ncbi:MAG TPA: ATP-dependent Clp protease adaptor ClpS [Spirochaetota bacterium]|nr:ATP-dependent Clp protease adaptor ClpS [Spirochaetota bacterium]HOL57333.1 ATP-dependent Clp protease adaptor ClpS [Spirochaetota bacterium]HPP04882.1 ATP-dependent Clp protease adaptor ClpS [Spirochaetota bacterium]